MYFQTPSQRQRAPQTHVAAVRAGLCLLILWGCAHSALSETVYRTVDDNGVVSFSDTPPGNSSAIETLQVSVPETNPDDLQQDRLEQMRETTDRMAADRMAREKHRAELRKLERESQPSQVVTREPDYDITLPYYYSSGWRHSRPRPGHPIVNPPLRPTPHVKRDTYPASLVRRSYQPRVREAFVD